MERRQWLAIGRRLGGISRCCQWWLGDWLRYGTEKWGERYVDAAVVTGYDIRSLANMASIAAAFHIARRRMNLSWSHHAVVAGLPEPEQERWLDVAAEDRLSVADLRTEVRSAARQGTITARHGAQTSLERPALTCPQCGFALPQRKRSVAWGK
jgi:hypothetical protein